MRTPCFTTAVVEPLYITTLGQPSISNRTVARAHTLTRVASSRHKQPQIKIRGKTFINIIIVRKRGEKVGRKRCTVGRSACWPRRQRPASSWPPPARPPPRSTPSMPPPSKPKLMYRSHPLLACLTILNLVRFATETLAAKGFEGLSGRLVW